MTLSWAVVNRHDDITPLGVKTLVQLSDPLTAFTQLVIVYEKYVWHLLFILVVATGPMLLVSF